MPAINSVNNFKVLQWSKLQHKAYRDKQKLFIVEGYNSVKEAFEAGCLKEIVSTDAITSFNIKSHHVTREVMEKLSSLATPTKIIGICHHITERDYKDSVLLISQIHHPGNLGTIIRSAVAFNVDTIVLDNSVDVYNQKVIQASQGMIFHLNILKRPMRNFIDELRGQDYQIIGTTVKEGLSLHTVKANKKRAVLIGNEGDGLGVELLSMCDFNVNIKTNSKCESLNVGVATSIILFSLSLPQCQ